jgi:glycosyltransferase involved in cell wall biosynthesis
VAPDFDDDTSGTHRRLIYLVAVGIDDPRFATMARWCVESLRRWGRFDGDIAILTDDDSAVLLGDLDDQAHVVVVDTGLLWESTHDRKRSERFQMARLNVHRAIDLTAYDTVMYLDVDMLAIRDIRPLFEHVTEFRYAREFQPMSGPGSNDSLTDAELDEARWRRAINSGTYVAPAAELEHCLAVWRAELDRSPAGGTYDQPALNAVILRNGFASAPMGSSSVGFPLMANVPGHFGDHTVLLHYAGNTDNAVFAMERHLLELRAGRDVTIERFDERDVAAAAAVARAGTRTRLVTPGDRALTIGIGRDANSVSGFNLNNLHWAREFEARGYRIVEPDATGDEQPDVVIHHDYEHDFLDATVRDGIPHVAVRTSDFGPYPAAWADRINERYDQLWVYSEWIRQHALDGGVEPDRIRLVPLGFDPDVFVPHGDRYDLPTTASFRFLFVGGAVMRKGIDVLLAAYTSEFSADDDVCLVIKDSPTNVFYSDGSIRTQIRALADDPDVAEIVLIDDHLPDADLAALYRSCNVGVWPYRAEGFLVPALESLACGTPTIVPEIGPTADFSTTRTSFLVPATAVRLPYSRRFAMRLGFEFDVDSVNIVGIRIEALAETMRRATNTPSMLLKEMAANGVAMAHGRFRWSDSVEAAESCIAELLPGADGGVRRLSVRS